MEISSLRSVAAIAVQGVDARQGQAATTSAQTIETDQYSSRLAAVAAKYDPRHIQVDQIPDLGRELYKNGLISGVESMAMSALPIILEDAKKNGYSIGMDAHADGSVDLLTYEQRQLGSSKSFGNSGQTGERQQAVNVLEALSSLWKDRPNQRNSTTSGLSAYQGNIDDASIDTQRVLNVLEALSATPRPGIQGE
jgi:hypothetical protein